VRVGEEVVGPPGSRVQQAAVAGGLERGALEGGAPHERVGHAHAIVVAVHRVAHVADAVRVHGDHQQVGRAGDAHQPRAVRHRQVEHHVVGRVHDVPVHVVADHMPAAGRDRDRRAVVAAARPARRQRPLAALARCVGGEFFAAVRHQQLRERQARPLGDPLELLEVPGRPAAGLFRVRQRQPLGIGEAQPALGHGGEVVAEEGEGGVDGVSRALADGAAELTVGTPRLNVHEGDRHPLRPVTRPMELPGGGPAPSARL